MMFEWSISVGTLATLLAILVSGIGFYWRQTYDSKTFKEDIHDIKIDLKQINIIITQLALQTQRLDTLEKVIYDLQHYRGFVRNVDDTSRNSPKYSQ